MWGTRSGTPCAAPSPAPPILREGHLAKDTEGFYRTRTHRAHQLFGTDERQMQELQFEVRETPEPCLSCWLCS